MPVMLAGGVDVAVDVGGTDELGTDGLGTDGLGAVGLFPLLPHATIDKTAVTTRVDRQVIWNWLWRSLAGTGLYADHILPLTGGGFNVGFGRPLG